MERRGFQHQAQIYAGADEYLAGTMPFVHEALIVGESLLIAVAEDKSELIADELGPDADRVLFLDMQKVGHNPASIIPLWRDFVDDHGGMPVRGIGEPAWAARSRAALEECHCHEGLLNVAFAPTSEWSLLCPYDAESLGEEVLERVALSHTHISRHGRTEESARFEADPDCLAGELPPPRSRPDGLDFGIAELGEVRRRAAAARPSAPGSTRAASPTWLRPPASWPPTASCTAAAAARCGSGARGITSSPRSKTAVGSTSPWSAACARRSRRRAVAACGSPTSSATSSRSAPRAMEGPRCASTSSPATACSSSSGRRAGAPGRVVGPHD